MTDDLHDDVREIRSLITQNLAETVKIKTAIWPDEGQPSLLTQHEDRLGRLENWRTGLSYAWGVVTALFGIHAAKH